MIALLPAIAELAQDRQWRVRAAIIEYMPPLAAQLGASYFNEKLGTMCIGWLQDCVFAIREAAIVNLRELIEVFGVAWATQQVIPQVLEGHKHSNYLYRMTVLYSIVAMAPVVGSDPLNNSLLPIALGMTTDPVPNVRFNAAKTLHQLMPLLNDHLVVHRVKPCLATMAKDPDQDVHYFASHALHGC